MKEKKQKSFMDSVHTYGRWSSFISVVAFILVGVSICWHYDIFPETKAAVTGCVTLSGILLVSGVIEFFTFIPKLGSGATYINSITGNVSNMKVPSIESAFQNLGIQDGTEDKEVIGIIVSCVASLFVIVLITLIILFTGALQPILTWEPIQPAFNYIMPAIYGIMLFGVIVQAGKYVLPTLALSLLLAFLHVSSSNLIFISVGFGLALFLISYFIGKKINKKKEENKE